MLYPNFITEKWGVKLIDVVIPNLWILKSHATRSFKSDSAYCFSWPEERCVRGSIIALLGHHMGSADPRDLLALTHFLLHYVTQPPCLFMRSFTRLLEICTFIKITVGGDCHNSSQTLILKRIKTWSRLILIETLNNNKKIQWIWRAFSTKTT